MYKHPTEAEVTALRSCIHWFYVDRYDVPMDANAMAERDNYPLDVNTVICCYGDSGEVLGFVSWTGKDINILYVSGLYRHKGIGSRLLYMAMKEIGEGVTATVRPDWQDSIKFLERLGFGSAKTTMQVCRWSPIGRTPEEVLTHLREERGLTREEAADKASLTKEDVLRAEDDVHSVSIDVLCTMARTYGVSVGYILTPDLDVCRTELPTDTTVS